MKVRNNGVWGGQWLLGSAKHRCLFKALKGGEKIETDTFTGTQLKRVRLEALKKVE